MKNPRIDFLVAAASFGAAVTGLLGIIAAVFTLFLNPIASAGFLLASAFSFGFLANAILRD
ncbi:MAG: hypothetical protein SF066_08810 [Thermoanaerobaculia bacterium]|nr:hypothetical protein [Thermoanaerobaculia bacterium]